MNARRPKIKNAAPDNRLPFTRLFIFCAPIALGACCSVPQNTGNPVEISEVVERVKADLQIYHKYAAAIEDESPLKNSCKGAVRFTIDSVQISLTTQTDITNSKSASLTLPVGSGTFGPTWGTSLETKNTQTLTFNVYPKAPEKPGSKKDSPGEIDEALFPISAGLKRLREGLLVASQKEECLSLIPIAKGAGSKAPDDPGNTYAFGFTVTKNSNRGGDFKFTLFSLGAASTTQKQAGNTITVAFRADASGAAAAAFTPQ